MDSPTTKAHPRLWRLWAILLALGFLGRLLYGYEVDELMHLHTAWRIGQGDLPYRDFYDNHLPVWHHLISPLVRSFSDANFWVLLGCRLLALAIMLGGLFCFYRLNRRIAPNAAAWSVGAYILIHPFGSTGFELRPDWTAMVCILASFLLLLRAMSKEDTKSIGFALIAGILGGLAIGMTQKSSFLLSAGVFWLLITCLAGESKHQRAHRAYCLFAILLGLAIPIATLFAVYSYRGALQELFQYGVQQNLGWMKEDDLLAGAQESLLANFFIFAFAFVRVIQIIRGWRANFATASAQSLVALVLLFGVFAFIRTPVPLAQWFLFLIVPWAASLGSAAIYDFASSENPLSKRLPEFAIGCLIALIALRWYNILIVLFVWGLVFFFGGRKLLQITSSDDRIKRAFNLALGIGMLVYIGRIVDEVRLGNGKKQAAYLADVQSRLGPNDSVLALWPNMAPFRRGATFHTFAIGGIYTTTSVEALQDEYISALKQGRTRIVIMRPIDVYTWQPRFAEYVRTHGNLIRRERVNLQIVEAYEFPKQ